jgi:hypothetical protein
MSLSITFSDSPKNQEIFDVLNLQPLTAYTFEEINYHLLSVLSTGDPKRCEQARKLYAGVERRAAEWMSPAYNRSVRPLIAEHGRDFVFRLDSEGNVSNLEVAAYRRESSPKRAFNKADLFVWICSIASAVIFFGGIVPTLIKIKNSPPQPVFQQRN